MTHKDFMKQSSCKFQFTPTREGTCAIDTNFNLYFIHINRGKTSISLATGTSLKNVATLNHVLPVMTFEPEALNKAITLIYNADIKCINKLRNLKQALEVQNENGKQKNLH